MTGPLDGLRVLDLTHVLNGPFCTMLLGHMGAQVIKLEHGEGDRFRHAWMPADADHDGYEFLVVNANKKGITLNLKHERGKEIFRELVAKSDVVVENFSLGVMERLGLGYEALREINPRVVYASSKGYGDSGPAAGQRANASTIMAATGWTDVSWEFSGATGSKPQGIGDEAAGISMALGVLAALHARERTGVGQKVEVSMQEALLGFMVSNLHTLFEGMSVAQPPKRCADGYVSFHLPDMTDALWRAFATSMGHPEAVDDPRFATVAARREHYAACEEEVTAWVEATPRDRLGEVFIETGISAAPVVALGEVLDDEHLRARSAFTEVEDPRAGTVTMLSPWIRFSDGETGIAASAPGVGEHNAEVYGELLGLSPENVEELARDGVL